MLLAAVDNRRLLPSVGKMLGIRAAVVGFGFLGGRLAGHGWAVQPAVADTEVAVSKQVSGCGSEPPFRQDRRCGLPRGSSTDDV